MRRIVIPAIVTFPLVVLFFVDGSGKSALRLDGISSSSVVDVDNRIRTAIGWLRGWRKLRKRNRCKSYQQNARFPRHSAGARLPHFYRSSKQITADISLTILRSRYFAYNTSLTKLSLMECNKALFCCIYLLQLRRKTFRDKIRDRKFLKRLSGNQGRDNMIDL